MRKLPRRPNALREFLLMTLVAFGVMSIIFLLCLLAIGVILSVRVLVNG